LKKKDMPKFIPIFFTLLIVTLFLQAQNPAPCGSPAYKSEWLKNYQKHPEAFKGLSSAPLYVPMTIHNVGTDQGQGYYSYKGLLDAFCVLNQDFEPAEITFFMNEDVRYINNTAFNSHDTVIDGGLFMLQYDIENTINTYFVSDPAGNCGYNLPWASIAMNKGCSGPTSHTWAHEVGHNLSLPHPFFGWEGGVSWDNTVPHNYSNAAPTTVLANYTNFKDSLYLDTLIIDTVLVELMDRSNCQEAADGFCDTYPDYISSRWNCNNNGESPTLQTDPNGTTFRSDGTLIMSYSDDICANRFSQEQMNAMRANLQDEKPNLISTAAPLAQVDVNFNWAPLYPQANETVNPNNVSFEWEAVDHATHYLIQVSRLPSFAVNEVETVVTENRYLATDLTPGVTFFWRIRPFNFYSTCAGFSSFRNFKTGQATNVRSIAERSNDVKIYPVPAKSGQTVWITWEGEYLSNPLTNYTVVNLLGKKVAEGTVALNKSQSSLLNLPTQLSAGTYIVSISIGDMQIRKKLIISGK
jgi:hypothetical protein